MKYYSLVFLLSIVTVSHGCSDSDPDCSKKIKYCNDTNYQPLMEKYCPLTCNFCTTVTPLPTYGPCVMGECPVGFSCTNSVCMPTTISTTPGYNCIDHADNCEALKTYCTNPNYLPLMQENCAKTCGFCQSSVLTRTTTAPTTTTQSPTGPCVLGSCPNGNTCINNLCYPVPSSSTPITTTTVLSCVDYATNCQQLKDYCNNSSYQEIMKEQCAKTCGYCY
uniref:ShKT domain-containing protein n=1 Tax=Strongyloides venezuelensis TaxID=75913 RepID=A0A0K0FAQ6_STRVS